jgi:hypothetical protein
MLTHIYVLLTNIQAHLQVWVSVTGKAFCLRDSTTSISLLDVYFMRPFGEEKKSIVKHSVCTTCVGHSVEYSVQSQLALRAACKYICK